MLVTVKFRKLSKVFVCCFEFLAIHFTCTLIRNKHRLLKDKLSHVLTLRHFFQSGFPYFDTGRGWRKKAWDCPLPPSIVVPASVCFSYCEILRNVAKFFPISPDFHPSGIPPPAPSSPSIRRLPIPIMHQSIPAAPIPPRANPRALALFLFWVANSRGWG